VVVVGTLVGGVVAADELAAAWAAGGLTIGFDDRTAAG
jgi:hypothetical protein